MVIEIFLQQDSVEAYTELMAPALFTAMLYWSRQEMVTCGVPSKLIIWICHSRMSNMWKALNKIFAVSVSTNISTACSRCRWCSVNVCAICFTYLSFELTAMHLAGMLYSVRSASSCWECYVGISWVPSCRKLTPFTRCVCQQIFLTCICWFC